MELLLEHLRPLAPLAWNPADNFHVTTKFIGMWPDERLAELKAALETVPKRGPIEIKVAGFGWFDNPHHPRALFAGIAAPDTLSQLKKDVEDVLEPLGVPREDRPYRPHLTLARVKGKVELATLRQGIASLPGADFGISVSAKHLLYRSEPGGKNSVYRVIGEFPL